jgi:hypothetical protein
MECKVAGCHGTVNELAKHGKCNYHRTIELGEFCSVGGCSAKVTSRGFCTKHYTQEKEGRFLWRATYDPKDFIAEGDICKIKTYNKYDRYITDALIDAEEYGKVKGYKWYIQADNRVQTFISRTSYIYLHQMILGAQESGKYIDHINNNRLDNRKSNLKFCFGT